MEIPKGFKKTEVGIIPDDWDIKKIGDCLLRNPDYGINAAAVPYNESLPVYLRITDIAEDGKYSRKNLVSVNNLSSDSYYLQEGDLVFARTGASVGKTYLYNKNDGKLVFAGFLIRVKTNEKILLPDYLKYFTQTKIYWNWIAANSMRTGQPGINGNEYKELFIPLPPTKAEQAAIAEALNDADALMTELEKLIAKKKAIKQGAMQELLTGKRRLVGFEQKKGFKRSDAGTIPADWQVPKLIEIADFENGKAHEQFIDDKGEYIVVNSKFISTEGNIRKFSNKNLSPLKKGSIAIVMSDIPNGRALAKCYLVEKNNRYTLNQRIGCIKPNEDIDYRYLFYKLNRNIYFLSFDSGSGQTNLRRNEILDCPVAIPPTKAEQTAIATVLSDMEAEIAALEKKLDKYKMLKQGMMQKLLTGKIRLMVNC